MEKIAFVFPGQGTQKNGMGKKLYENSKTCKKIYDEVFGNLKIDLKSAMFEENNENINKTLYAQPAIVLNSIVLAKFLLEKTYPDFVAGHSLGEYSALYASGVLNITDSVNLAYLRGQIMQNYVLKTKGKMAAVIGLEASKIIEVCSKSPYLVEAVNFNEPNQTVISGEEIGIEKIADELKKYGARKIKILNVAGPFHSSLMKEAGENLKLKIKNLEFHDAVIPIIANTSSDLLKNKQEIKDELYKQMFGPVRWVETINKLKINNVSTIYEIGMGRVLKSFIKKIDPLINVISVNDEYFENINF